MSGTLSEWLWRRRRESKRHRLVYSAKARCDCGAGFAYDRRSRSITWDCSAILLGDAMLLSGERGVAAHSIPCSYYELVSERHPAAQGLTTRPA